LPLISVLACPAPTMGKVHNIVLLYFVNLHTAEVGALAV
jgi:hypothetical protein